MNVFFKQKDLLGFIALAVIIVILPLFVESKYYFIVLNVIGLNTIVVVGLNLLIGFAGQISLGHAAFYGLGSYFSGILTVNYGFPLWPAMLVGMLATGIIAYLIGYPSLKLRGHYLVMATLGFGIIVNILMGELEQFTGGHDGLIGIPQLVIGGLIFDNDLKNFYLIWGFVFISMLAARNLLNSRVGRALRAVHGSETAANSLGINTADYKVKVFVLSAMFASISGSLSTTSAICSAITSSYSSIVRKYRISPRPQPRPSSFQTAWTLFTDLSFSGSFSSRWCTR